MVSLFQGHFTNGFCKMWGKDRPKGRGLLARGDDLHYLVREIKFGCKKK
jgi:hypothetical protein